MKRILSLALLVGPLLAHGQDEVLPSAAKDVDPMDLLRLISLSNVLWALVFLAGGYALIKVVTKTLEFFAERSTRMRITIKGLIPLVRILLWIGIIAWVIKGIFNPPLEMLMAGLASVAIAVGLAAQDLLKNIFGGLMVLIDKPFQIGDKIQVGKHYGEVIEIGLRTTRIVTPDDSMVVIPNMELMNSSVSNANSGELNCQVIAEIILPIDVDTQQARKIAIEAAQVSKYIYLKKPIIVLFSNEMHQHKSFLKMRLKAYVMDIRHEFPFQSDMTEIVLRELLGQRVMKKEEVG
jgi:MscS family membrane protein